MWQDEINNEDCNTGNYMKYYNHILVNSAFNEKIDIGNSLSIML